MPFPGFIPFGSNVVQPPVPGWFMRLGGATSGYAGLKCPTVGPSVDWTLPSADGTANQALVTNASGVLSFASALVRSATSPNYEMQAQAADHVVLALTGASGQTADLFQSKVFGGTAGNYARINNLGQFSNSQGLANSEAFGHGATNASNESVAFGAGANTTSASAVAMGRAATAGNCGIAIGRLATAPANAFVAGAASAFNDFSILDVYFGNGVSHATPTNYTIHGVGGLGTNIAGGALILAAGKSTGSATPAAFKIQSTVAGSSSSTAQTLADVVTVQGVATGNVLIQTMGATHVGQVIKGSATQTGNLQEWQKSDGTVFGAFAGPSATLGNNTGLLTIMPAAAGDKALVIRRGGSALGCGIMYPDSSSNLVLDTNNADLILNPSGNTKTVRMASIRRILGNAGIRIDAEGDYVSIEQSGVTRVRFEDVTTGNVSITAAGATHVALRLNSAATPSADIFQAVPSGVTAGQRARINYLGDFSNPGASVFDEKFGAFAVAASSGGAAFGYNAQCQQSSAVAIGCDTTAQFAGVAIGRGAAAPANTLVIGSSSYSVDTIYFGKGVTDSSASNITIRGTGGSGSNNPGGFLKLAPGVSRGTATPGYFAIQGTVATSSGSSVQSLVDIIGVQGVATGNVLIQTAGATHVGLKIKLTAAQSGYPFEIRDSNNALLAGFESAGKIFLPNGTAAAPSIQGSNNGINFLSNSDIQLCMAGSAGLVIGNAGSITMKFATSWDNAKDISFGTTTGTKIGTGTTEKIGFWGATAVVQQILATGAGATVDNVISLLQTLGLCKQS